MEVGDAIGIHYPANAAQGVIPLSSSDAGDLCCGLTVENLFAFHSSTAFNEDLSLGYEISGVQGGVTRAAAVTCDVHECKAIRIIHVNQYYLCCTIVPVVR